MIITRLTYRFLTTLLYRQLAIFYDVIAWLVSFGHWKQWIYSVAPLIYGKNILEIGFGPGHMLHLLETSNKSVFGVDPSPQMNKISKKRLTSLYCPQKTPTNQWIVRGIAQYLPFKTAQFDTIYATFPTEYIFDPQTLSEIKRLLVVNGILIILLCAIPHKKSLPGRLLYCLYTLTGQRPSDPAEFENAVKNRLMKSGFKSSHKWCKASHADLLIVQAIPYKKYSV